MTSAAAVDRSGNGMAAPPSGAVIRRGRRTWPAFVAVVLLGALLVLLHISAYRPLSPFDEPQHVDYVHRLIDGGIPAAGDPWVLTTAEATACRTVDAPDSDPPRCGRPGRATAPATDGGPTGAFRDSPVYFLVPAGAVLVTGAVGLPADQVDVMRVSGLFWLVAALGLLWLLWREADVQWPARAGLSLALIASPVVLLAQATVTNDAAALAAGAAVTLATLRWEQGRAGLWLPVVTVGLALALNATNVAVAVAACAFVVVRARQRSRSLRPRASWRSIAGRPTLQFVGWVAATAAVVGYGWSAIARSRASADGMLVAQSLSPAAGLFDPDRLAAGAPALISPLAPGFYQAALAGTGSAVAVAHVVSAGLLVLAVVGAVRSMPGSTVRALAIAVALAALAFGPVVTVLDHAVPGSQFTAPARYGFALVPGMLVVAGTAVRSRRGAAVLLLVGAVCYALIARKLLS